MIKIENVVLPAKPWLVGVARGMRNSYNSWDNMDTDPYTPEFIFGPNDYKLAERLVTAGPSHAKFMRMIPVIFDVTAPLYWWKEADTYKIGTVRNSCSTMHKVMAKEFTKDDFSFFEDNKATNDLIYILNACRDSYLKEIDPKRKREIWDFVIALLPSAYNQRSTMVVNYQVLSAMYHQRKNHKLAEWREFCDWIETLPMSDLITGEE